jgi:hypothetical protein
MAQATQTLPRERRYGITQRRDRWWLEPVLFGVTFFVFAIYTTISALLGEHWTFEIGPYLSPYFEPLIRPGWLPDWFSPAIFILWAPLSFRLTCYYYRKAYYRSYFLSPPGCAVREPAKSYSGESKFPFILQNVHRFTMYLAVLFVVMLWYGALRSFRFEGAWGIGVGSVILTANAFALMMYTFGCHSFRHMVGGSLDCYSCTNFTRTRHSAWRLVTKLNERHRFWAWTSMIGVGLTDLYIHLVANGVITDPHTWNSF